MPALASAIILSATVLLSPAWADVVGTLDGRTLEGVVVEKTVEVGGISLVVLEITTPLGSTTIPRSEVKTWERKATPIEEYESRRTAIDAGDANAQYGLGRWCEGKGLGEQARTHLERALALDPEHERARLALGWRRIDGEWVSPERVLQAAGFVRHEGKWVLPGERELLGGASGATGGLDAATERHILALSSFDPEAREIARKALRGADPDRVIPQLLRALKSERWDMRAGAAELLGALGGKEVETSLYTAALTDRLETVRTAAVRGLAAGNHPDAYAPFVRALAAEEQTIRLNAVRALGDLGDDRAVGYLVKHIRYSGAGPRAHIYVGQQIAYIRDYDVEVAQRAAIADPIIGTIQDGLVLDVRVASVRGEAIILERRITGASLNHLTGAEPASPEDDSEELADAWSRWWREHRHEYEPGGERYRP